MNKELYKISFVIPMYNACKYIHRCIKSIQNQKYDNIEIILVDDGSKDDSVSVVKNMQREDSRIKLATQENQGPATARNNGLSYVTGDYVIFVDVDDYIGEGYLQKVISLLTDGSDWYSFAHYDGCNGKYSKTQSLDTKFENKNIPTLYVNAIDAGMTIDYLWDKIFKTSIIKANNVQFPDIRNGEDTIFNLRYAQACKSITISGDAFYYYQKNENSISLRYKKQFLTLISLLRDEISNIKKLQIHPDARFEEWSSDHIIQGDVFGLIDNYLYCKNSQLKTKEKYSIIQKYLFKNETLLRELKHYNGVKVMNQKVILFFLNNRLFYTCFIYAAIVGFIKRMML